MMSVPNIPYTIKGCIRLSKKVMLITQEETMRVLELRNLDLTGLNVIENNELKAVEAALRKIKVEVTDKVNSMILATKDDSELVLEVYPNGYASLYDVWHPNIEDWNEVQAFSIRYYQEIYKTLVHFGLVEKVANKSRAQKFLEKIATI